MLKNDIFIPLDRQLQDYITCIQYFKVDEPIVIETIPNGHMDLTILFDGQFDINDLIENQSITIQKAYVFQITTRKLFLNFPMTCSGLNIKFKPTIKSVLNVNLDDLLTQTLIDKIRLSKPTDDEFNIYDIEHVLIEFLNQKEIDLDLKKIINGIIYAKPNQKLIDIAEDFKIHLKQMARLIKKHVGVSPKELRSLQRFYLAADQMRQMKLADDRSFSEAIPLTYYDQSHFIKECRKITGLNPKRVFKMMNLDIADLLN